MKPKPPKRYKIRDNTPELPCCFNELVLKNITSWEYEIIYCSHLLPEPG